VGGITGAVGDEDTIEVVGNLVDRVVIGEHSDTGSAADQAPENVLLDTTIDDGNVALRVGCAYVEGSLRADLTDEVNLLGVDEGLILISVVLLTDGDTSQRGTLFTEVGDNRTGVNTRDGRNALASAPFTKTLDGGPMAILFSHVCDYDTSGLEVRRLEVLEKTMLVFLRRRHTVVANQGLGEDQDLTTVRRVSQGLGVSDQGSREDGLAGDVGASSERLPVEDRTISDREGCAFMGNSSITDRSHEPRLDRSVHGREGSGPGGHGLEESGSEHVNSNVLSRRECGDV
jgi:hypothetical protein